MSSTYLLSSNLEQFSDELDLSRDVAATDIPNLPFPDHYPAS